MQTGSRLNHVGHFSALIAVGKNPRFLEPSKTPVSQTCPSGARSLSGGGCDCRGTQGLWALAVLYIQFCFGLLWNVRFIRIEDVLSLQK